MLQSDLVQSMKKMMTGMIEDKRQGPEAKYLLVKPNIQCKACIYNLTTKCRF